MIMFATLDLPHGRLLVNAHVLLLLEMLCDFIVSVAVSKGSADFQGMRGQ